MGNRSSFDCVNICLYQNLFEFSNHSLISLPVRNTHKAKKLWFAPPSHRQTFSPSLIITFVHQTTQHVETATLFAVRRFVLAAGAVVREGVGRPAQPLHLHHVLLHWTDRTPNRNQRRNYFCRSLHLKWYNSRWYFLYAEIVRGDSTLRPKVCSKLLLAWSESSTISQTWSTNSDRFHACLR